MKRIEKTCKHCKKIFYVEYVINGSGSAGAVRKKYCSVKCKKDWYKIPENGVKQKVECKICCKEFYLPPSQAKTRVTCSKKCYAKHMSSVNTKHVKIQKQCNSCLKHFEISENSAQKFCSPSCFYKSCYSRKDVFCEACDTKLTVKKSATTRFCNKTCVRKGLSLGLIKSHINGRIGWRIDIQDSPYFKSSLEADYARYCIYKNVRFEYEKKVFETEVNGKKRFYTPDFYLPDSNEFIELKGVRESENLFSKMLNSNSAARESLNSADVKIKVMYMNDFYSMLRSSDLYDKIPNLENKNYGRTAHLIKTYKDNLN
jgi:hypothetical protein